MEQFAASNAKDPRDFDNLIDLVKAICTHLSKYALLLDTIEKHADKAKYGSKIIVLMNH